MHIPKKIMWTLVVVAGIAVMSGLYYYRNTAQAGCISYYDKDGQTLLYKECD